MTTLSNLDWVSGKANPAGIKSIAYFVRKSDISIYPKLTGASYTGDIELVAGKKFLTIYTTQGVGKVTFELVGNKDGKQPVNKATLSYPDINKAAKEFVTTYCNDNVVFIIPHYTTDGVSYAVFGLEYDCDVKFTGDGGDKPGSDKTFKIEIESADWAALPIYTGVINTDKGSLNCETGVFTPAVSS